MYTVTTTRKTSNCPATSTCESEVILKKNNSRRNSIPFKIINYVKRQLSADNIDGNFNYKKNINIL